MKNHIVFLLILLSHVAQNASAQAVSTSDKKPAVIADAEIKRGPLADFYELVAQHPVRATSPVDTANKTKTPPQESKTNLARQSSATVASKPASD